jgi:hypothetical protein
VIYAKGANGEGRRSHPFCVHLGPHLGPPHPGQVQSSGTAAGRRGLKYDLNFTGAVGSLGGPVYGRWMIEPGATVLSNVGAVLVFNSVQASAAVGPGGLLKIEGSLSTAGSGQAAGIVSLRWAQNSSNAALTSVWAGSYVEHSQAV